MITFWTKLEQGQGSRIRQNIRIDVNWCCREVKQVRAPSEWIYKCHIFACRENAGRPEGKHLQMQRRRHHTTERDLSSLVLYLWEKTTCMSVFVVMSDLLTAHVKIDVDKMKTELDLHKKYIICEQLGRYSLVCHSDVSTNRTSETVACLRGTMVRPPPHLVWPWIFGDNFCTVLWASFRGWTINPCPKA